MRTEPHIYNPARGRPARSQEMKQARRRRNTGDLNRMVRMNLDIFAPEQLDLENYVYRWVDDLPGRIHALTKFDDYDFVDSSEIKGFIPMEDAKSEGDSRIRMVANTGGAHQSPYTYLLKKPRWMWEDDQEDAVNMRQAMMERRVYQGEAAGSASQGAASDPDIANSYVPEGNQVGHGGEHVTNPMRRRGKIGV